MQVQPVLRGKRRIEFVVGGGHVVIGFRPQKEPPRGVFRPDDREPVMEFRFRIHGGKRDLSRPTFRIKSTPHSNGLHQGGFA